MITSNDASAVYEIDINKKYILAFEVMVSQEIKEKIKNDIAKWVADKDRPILCLFGTSQGVKLVKVDSE